MAQKKSHEVDGWIARQQPSARIVLIYGEDHGLVSERAARFAGSLGLPLDDPFTVIKLDAAGLEKDPGRLLGEARAIAMFAAERLIWVRGAGNDKRLAEDVRELIAEPSQDATIVIEALELRKGSALRSLVEAGEGAMALPCYADEGRDLDRLIDEAMHAANLSIEQGARLLLRGSLGGDRLATRGELEKLTLFAGGQGEITVADVTSVISDVSDTSTDEVVDAAIVGNAAAVDSLLSRALVGSGSSYSLIAAATRQFQQLHMMRSALDEGAQLASVVGGARPQIMFKRRETIEQALKLWTVAGVQKVLAALHALTLTTRRQPGLEGASIRRTFFMIVSEAGARSRRA